MQYYSHHWTDRSVQDEKPSFSEVPFLNIDAAEILKTSLIVSEGKVKSLPVCLESVADVDLPPSALLKKQIKLTHAGPLYCC